MGGNEWGSGMEEKIGDGEWEWRKEKGNPPCLAPPHQILDPTLTVEWKLTPLPDILAGLGDHFQTEWGRGIRKGRRGKKGFWDGTDGRRWRLVPKRSAWSALPDAAG